MFSSMLRRVVWQTFNNVTAEFNDDDNDNDNNNNNPLAPTLEHRADFSVC
jgi:hypothetical protein